MSFENTDVFVVGGGPAGLVAAIAARRQGARVTLADGARPPIDKACGEGLMPQGVRALARLGIELPSADSHPIQGVEFFTGDRSAGAKFSQGFGLGVRRTKLHNFLLKAASIWGVRLLWNSPVSALDASSAFVGDKRLRFDYLIGADGGSSTVRSAMGFRSAQLQDKRFGFRRHFAVAPWSDCVEVYWAPGFQVYVTPVGDGQVGVAVISRDSKLRVAPAISYFPNLARRLRAAEPTSAERGSASVSRRLPRVTRGNVALVGDASGSLDAITGDGLSLAFEQAEALGDALRDGDLSIYEAAHRRIRRVPSLMSSALLAMDRYPLLNSLVMRGLAAKPTIFSQLLNFHTTSELPVQRLA